MSDANVENLRVALAMYSTQTIQALLEAWRRGEVDPTFLALLDPGVTYEDYDRGHVTIAELFDPRLARLGYPRRSLVREGTGDRSRCCGRSALRGGHRCLLSRSGRSVAVSSTDA